MTSLLFHPLPPCRADVSVSESSFTSYCGAKSATAKTLSLQTKSGTADTSVFREYLQHFPTSKVPFRSSWSHPFLPDRLSQSNRSEVEVAATMYNFLAFSHAKILTMNATSQSDLVSIRALLTDSVSAVRTLSDYAARCDHAGFTREFAAFVAAYQRFVISLWQFACGQVANSSDYNLARYLTRVVIEVTAAQAALKPVVHPVPFGLIVNGTVDYYTALARFYFGKGNEGANEFGNAIANYRSTIGIMSRLKKASLPPALANSIDGIVQTAQGLKAQLEKRKVPAPMDPPPLPPPASYPTLEESHAATSPSVPSPSAPPRPPGTAGTTPPAAATSSSPTLAEWEAMMVLKNNLIERANRMIESQDGKVQAKGRQFRQAIAAVNAADAEVARTVRAFSAGAPNVSREAVAEAITKTQLFYTDLEVRMNLFENTGR